MGGHQVGFHAFNQPNSGRTPGMMPPPMIPNNMMTPNTMMGGQGPTPPPLGGVYPPFPGQNPLPGQVGMTTPIPAMAPTPFPGAQGFKAPPPPPGFGAPPAFPPATTTFGAPPVQAPGANTFGAPPPPGTFPGMNAIK